MAPQMMSKTKRKETTVTQPKNQYSAFENGLDELTGAEIFEIFTNQENFLELCAISTNFPDTMNRFCWRLKYVLGETFLDIQRRLSKSNILSNCILLDSSDVHQLGSSILERGMMINQSKEFEKFKKVLEAAFNSGSCDESALLTIYGYCMKIWKPPVPFQMDLTFYKLPSEHEQKQPSYNTVIKKGPNYNQHVQRQPLETIVKKNWQIPQLKPIKKTSVQRQQPPRPPAVIPDDDIIHLNDGGARPVKTLNRNWTLAEQQCFCRIYIENDGFQNVRVQLQKKFGPDSRWSSARQVQSKISSIIAKVFKKFDSLDTTNAQILKFRSLRSFILSSDRIKENQRSILCKHFAALYQAMLNVNQQKKAIISAKLMDVIRLCESIQKDQ